MLFSPTEPERRRQDAFFSNRTGYVASGLALEGLEGLHQEVLQVLKKKQALTSKLYSGPYENIETKYIAASVRCATIPLDNVVQNLFASCIIALTDGF